MIDGDYINSTTFFVEVPGVLNKKGPGAPSSTITMPWTSSFPLNPPKHADRLIFNSTLSPPFIIGLVWEQELSLSSSTIILKSVAFKSKQPEVENTPLPDEDAENTLA